MRKVLFIFSVLTDGDVEWLAQAGERIQIEPGKVLIPLGSRIDTLYFVLEGRLAVRTKNGERLAFAESGEIIGELSLVDPAPTTVSVEAVADTTLLRLPDSVVREKLASDLGFASRFYRALCVFMADRLRHTTRRMGYGSAMPDEEDRDELNDDLLDNVHLAGARFERMLRRLAG
jgi:CRP/FNR family cyclic AMP-dependent transcriptional regulator